MVIPSVGTVVLVRFPFSDLSQSKLRPAVALAMPDAMIGFYARSLASLTPTQLRSKSQTPIYRQAHFERTVTPDPASFSPQTPGSSREKIGELRSEKQEQIIRAIISLLDKNIAN